MYINDIDNLFDTILNNFYVYLTENNVFKILLQDTGISLEIPYSQIYLEIYCVLS